MSSGKESRSDSGSAAKQQEPDLQFPSAAERALAEAAERRSNAEALKKKTPVEVGGRDGPDPVRYGDWEKDGTVSDF